ncbi:uncharacterized protein [Eucyclogobius newberryi]|uniref:uncharacterized protein n=1 Tax=Eucyclogobius newberryi TaxID=166745 RepID=UPI003B5B9916
MENTQRKAYDAGFKLKAIELAVKGGNRAAARALGVNESMVRNWRQQRKQLSQCKTTTKSFRGRWRRWRRLGHILEDMVNTQRGVQTDTFSPDLVKQEIPETSLIKEEPEEHLLKQKEEQLPEFTAVCVKSEAQSSLQKRPGSSKKFCITCKTKIWVACKRCPHCGNAQPQKKSPMDSKKAFSKAKEDQQTRKRRNSSTKEHDRALQQLDRFSRLGYYPVLLLAKEHEGRLWTEVKSSLDFQLPVNLQSRLKESFEGVVNIFQKISSKCRPGNMDEMVFPELHENSLTDSASKGVQKVFSPEPSETPQIQEEPEEKSSKNIMISDVFSLCDGNKTTELSADKPFSCPVREKAVIKTRSQSVNDSSLLQQRPTRKKRQHKRGKDLHSDTEEHTENSSYTDSDEDWELQPKVKLHRWRPRQPSLDKRPCCTDGCTGCSKCDLCGT